MNHPDHRAAADAVLDAVFPSAETRLIFPELLAEEGFSRTTSRGVAPRLGQAPTRSSTSRTTLSTKIAALREHKSQLGPWDPEPFVTGWATEQGKKGKLRAAEAFRRMVLEDF